MKRLGTACCRLTRCRSRAGLPGRGQHQGFQGEASVRGGMGPAHRQISSAWGKSFLTQRKCAIRVAQRSYRFDSGPTNSLRTAARMRAQVPHSVLLETSGFAEFGATLPMGALVRRLGTLRVGKETRINNTR